MAANTNIQITIKVMDAASAPLKRVAKRTEQVGKSAKKAKVDFIGFNRTLFTATAFAGMFTKAFQGVVDVLDVGTNFDRTVGQFERVLGPKGELIAAIKATTDNSIDLMASMEAGISLKNLGIVKNTKQLANIVSMAGTAAKLAGKDSAEGIKAYSQFMKTGAISHVQFLNLVAESNQELAAQMSILRSAGGPMGRVLQLQQKMTIMQKVLRAATIGELKGRRDLRDVYEDSRISLSILRMEAGRFLGSILAPFIDKMTLLADRFSSFLDNSRNAKDGIFFLVKSVISLTGAVGALAATFGTLRLMMIALSSLGFGFPAVIYGVVTLGSSLLAVTYTADGFISKLKLLGNFFKGIYQLVSSFNSDSGLSKIDEDLKKLLEAHGLYSFVKTISRVLIALKTGFSDLISLFRDLASGVDNFIGAPIRKVMTVISDLVDMPWSNIFTKPLGTIGKMIRALGALAVTLGSVWAVWKGFKMFKGLMSKVPIIGKFFQDGSDRPKGTSDDPLHVTSAGGSFASAMNEYTDKQFPKKGLLSKLLDFMKSGWTGLVGLLGTTITTTISGVLLAIGGAIVAGFAGWKFGKDVVNPFLDKYTSVDKGGIQMNAAERFFNMFSGYDEENQQAQMLMQASATAMNAKKSGLVSGKGSVASLRDAIMNRGSDIVSGNISVPLTQKGRSESLEQIISEASGAQKQALIEAFTEARARGSDAQGVITGEEYKTAIFEGFQAALKAEEVPLSIKAIANNTEGNKVNKFKNSK